jgi:hypothetical protein
LLKGDDLDQIWSDMGSKFQEQSHDRLTRCCVHQMGLSMLPQPQSIMESQILTSHRETDFGILSLGRYPFLEYAVLNMEYHAAMADAHDGSKYRILEKGASLRLRQTCFDTVPDLEGIQWRGNKLNVLYTEIGLAHQPAMFLACITAGNLEFVRVFVDGTQQTEDRSRDHGLVLQNRPVLAYLAGFGDEGILAPLIRTGRFDINSKDLTGETPLSHATPLSYALKRSSDTIVKLLLKSGADISACGGYYGNALQAAVVNGDELIERRLLENGIDVNTKGGIYNNALYAASAMGHMSMVKLLLKHGAKINARGGHYGNALNAAIENDHTRIVELLEAQGAILRR